MARSRFVNRRTPERRGAGANDSHGRWCAQNVSIPLQKSQGSTIPRQELNHWGPSRLAAPAALTHGDDPGARDVTAWLRGRFPRVYCARAAGATSGELRTSGGRNDVISARDAKRAAGVPRHALRPGRYSPTGPAAMPARDANGIWWIAKPAGKSTEPTSLTARPCLALCLFGVRCSHQVQPCELGVDNVAVCTGLPLSTSDHRIAFHVDNRRRGKFVP